MCCTSGNPGCCIVLDRKVLPFGILDIGGNTGKIQDCSTTFINSIDLYALRRVGEVEKTKLVSEFT